MSQSRQALILCTIFSLPLLIWFIAQLQFIDWNATHLQSLFLQTLFGLLLLQFFAITLLFISHPGNSWWDDALGATHILLFPMPFMALFWLTGSVSFFTLVKSFTLVASFAVCSFLLQQVRLFFSSADFPAIATNIEAFVTLLHILLAIMVWNFRDFWWGLLIL